MKAKSLPVRSDDSIIAEFLIWNAGDSTNKLNLFVEDENGNLTYREILKRKYEDKFEFNIYTCRSRDAVIDKYSIWHKNFQHIESTIFIIDKDFSIWTNEELEENNNLLIWEYFTLENYLINNEAAIYVFNTLLPSKNEEEIMRLFGNFDKWIKNQFFILKPLFISYAISYKYSLSKNTSIAPHRYYNKKESTIDRDKISEKVAEIKEKCVENSIDYEREYDEIESYYNSRPNEGLHELIKGKYLLTYLIYEINNKVKKEKKFKPPKEDFLYHYFVNKTPINAFKELWIKIDNLLLV